MHETPITKYFRFGYNMSWFRTGLVEGYPVHGKGKLLFALEDFFDHLDDLDLSVTKVVSRDLYQIYDDLKETEDDTTADLELVDNIKSEIKSIETTLVAELSLKKAFTVTEKRFEIAHLATNPKKLFASKVFHNLPELSQFDLAEACKCIAFERPTAAVFHLMRATEGYLKHYYYLIVKRKRIKVPMWNPMIAQLRARRDPPPINILDHLDNIRKNFRNPTQHPNATYDMDEAQDLLALTIDVTNRIYRDIKKRNS